MTEHRIEIKQAWFLENITAKPEMVYAFQIPLLGHESIDVTHYYAYNTDDYWKELFPGYGYLFYSEAEMNEAITRIKQQAIDECEREIKKWTDKLNSLK